MLFFFITPNFADERSVKFNPNFMRQAPGQSSDASAAALNTLAAQATLAPGRYQVEVSVNLAPAGRHKIDFRERSDGKGLEPCLSASLLRELGLSEQGLAEPLPSDERCVDLPALVPDATYDLDPGQLQLALSIPQIALRRDVAGSVAPERWDTGINAAFVSYQASAQHFSGATGNSRSSQDLYLNSGINLGGWRLRSSQSWRDDGKGQDWAHFNTYAQHDLPGQWGTLTLGETFSNGDVFRSLPIKGVQLATDMGMLPDVMQSYAPVIRGVAQTRAKLEVLQNGYPIYSTYVAAGPYEINDLGIGGSSGDLEIVLTEADGQVRRFIQPYSTLSNLLREGVWRYNLVVGRYDVADGIDDPALWQATLARGGKWGTTLYGGLLGSEYYNAANIGVARDFGTLGAVSLDMTQARTDLGEQGGQVQGQSYSVRYGKAFQTGTSLRFAGYRYSTEGYREFDEAVQQRNASSRYQGSRRSRLESSIYQAFGNRNSLSLTLSQDDYWHSNRQRRQYQFQFNTQYRRVSINLYASQSLSNDSSSDRIVGLGFTIPLDGGSSTTAGFDVKESNGHFSERATLNGGSQDNRLSYLASLANDERQHKTASVSMGYQTQKVNVGAGYTEADDYRSVSVNASGAVLAHADGIVLGQYLGETTALVHVPDVPGVGVDNVPGGSTDGSGYILASHMRPYRVNQVTLQTDQLGPDVEIENGATQVVPRRGAVALATFKARQVSRLILTLQHADGRPLPFGTQINDQQGEHLAVVGQAGQALVATDAQPQTLEARWGDRAEQRCLLPIDPASMPEEQGYRLQTLRCPTP
ncbi:fimbrial biogenesis outer membrane usher protein [Pseudomonas putida]|uniref:Fimbrial biogenesis outer membrane usher protein n=1 Tax=Pseudomonas putida TaxID=303 RepID=A0A4D6XHE0_PSEPU|nr:fimbrial biogenesis outer membrane usher protein [Pseudomonas putida]